VGADKRVEPLIDTDMLRRVQAGAKAE